MKSRNQSRRQLAIIATCLFLTLSICRAASPDENQKLCAVDPTTGNEECKGVYENTDGAADDTVDLPVPTHADGGSVEEEEVHIDPYEAWYEEETQGDGEEESEDDLSKCHDRHENCPDRAAHDECNTNPGFMHFQCPESCNACEDFYAANGEICTDNDASCSTWAKSGECAFNPGYMHNECRRSCLRCLVHT